MDTISECFAVRVYAVANMTASSQPHRMSDAGEKWPEPLHLLLWGLPQLVSVCTDALQHSPEQDDRVGRAFVQVLPSSRYQKKIMRL